MRNDDTALGPAASPAARGPRAAPSDRSATLDIGRRLLTWALRGPPWTYVALAVAGLAAALFVAGLES